MAKKKVMTKKEARAVWADPQSYGIAAACSAGVSLYLGCFFI